jgi:hypothetical protein
VTRIAHHHLGVYGCGLKRIRNNLPYSLGIEILARKYVQVHVIGLLHKMRADVGGLNQLDKRVTLLVARSKHDNLGRTVWNHINLLDQCGGKVMNLLLGADRTSQTGACIEHKVVSPKRHYTYNEV